MKKSEIGLNFILFVITVAIAWYEQWTAKDLLWSLWISSLTLGYSFIVLIIVTSAMHPRPLGSGFKKRAGLSEKAKRLLKDPKLSEKAKALYEDVELSEKDKKIQFEGQSIAMGLFFLFVIVMFTGLSYIALTFFFIVLFSTLVAAGSIMRKTKGWRFMPDSDKVVFRIIISLPYSVFMLAFFTVHFGGFHFVHSIFLNGFFPLLDRTPFGETIEGTFIFFKDLISTALYSYWIFILVSALSRLNAFRQVLQKGNEAGFFYPYLNVIRMHIMIFVIAFLWKTTLQPFIIYAALFLYFFPVYDFAKSLFMKNKENNHREHRD